MRPGNASGLQPNSLVITLSRSSEAIAKWTARDPARNSTRVDPFLTRSVPSTMNACNSAVLEMCVPQQVEASYPSMLITRISEKVKPFEECSHLLLWELHPLIVNLGLLTVGHG